MNKNYDLDQILSIYKQQLKSMGMSRNERRVEVKEFRKRILAGYYDDLTLGDLEKDND